MVSTRRLEVDSEAASPSVRGQHSKNNVDMEVDCAEGRTEQSPREKAAQIWTL